MEKSRYDVRKDRWRLLTMQEIEERTKLSKDRQFHAGADGGAPSITDGKASTTNVRMDAMIDRNFNVAELPSPFFSFILHKKQLVNLTAIVLVEIWRVSLCGWGMV